MAYLFVLLLSVVAVVAFSQFHADGRRGWRGLLRRVASPSLREAVFRSLVVISVVPCLGLTLMLAGMQVETRRQQVDLQVSEAARSAAYAVDSFLQRHITGVASAAGGIQLDGRTEAGRLEQHLLGYHALHPDFLTMVVADRQGIIQAGSQVGTDKQAFRAEVAGRRIADRDYFRVPMATGGDYISSAFRGRGFGSDPIVAISSPLEIDGERWGIVEGSLNLSAFGRLDERYRSLFQAQLILLDDKNKVVYVAPETGYGFLQDMTRTQLSQDPGAAGTWALELPRMAGEFIGADAQTRHGWRVIVLKPRPSLAAELAAVAPVALLCFLGSIVAAAALGWGLARRITRPLNRLLEGLRAYQVGRHGSPFGRLDDLPSEYISAFRKLHWFTIRQSAAHQKLAGALAESKRLQGDLQDVLQHRELEIFERTQELQEANSKLKRLARIDVLTELANRRWFDQWLEQRWRAAARDGGTLVVLMLDVDYFKRYNDAFGHPAGDAVLRRVGQVIRESVMRPLDMPARYGGEEFAVILSSSDVDGAVAVAERIRAAVVALDVEHPDSPFGVVTLSIGVALIEPAQCGPHANIHAADAALYRAKAEGRNRVVVFDASQDAAGGYVAAAG